jgi:glycosyltransferase involved in cell wall biosynthesis
MAPPITTSRSAVHAPHPAVPRAGGPGTPGSGVPRRLRVCHLAYTFYENDNRVIRYAELLAGRGHEVDVIALRRPGQPRRGASGGVRIHRIQSREVSEKSRWSYLAKLLVFCLRSGLFLSVAGIRKRYDVVHVHNVPDFLVFAALVPRLLGARVVLDIHDVVPELYAGKFGTGNGSPTFRVLARVERLSCRFASHVIVANHLWHATLTGRSVPPAKCTPILNHPDLNLFKPADGSRPSDRFVFLYPGTLNRHQGVDLAIEAFALAVDRMPVAELHIYGEGPDRRSLAALVEARGLTGKVRIMDRVPLAEIAGVMASAHVGVVPKRADGFGNEAFSTKVLEFMACGVPVILSRTRVDTHYFDGSLVRFFTPGDDADLAAAMLAEYEARLEPAARAQRAQEFVRAESWQARCSEYERIVDRLAPPSWPDATVHGLSR